MKAGDSVVNLLKRAFVCITALVIVFTSVISPVAASSVAADEVQAYVDEYVDNSEHVLYLNHVAQNMPSFYNTAVADMIYSFGPDFAAVGATLTAAAPWAAGLLMIGGGILFGGYQMYDAFTDMIDAGPEAWNSFCTLVSMAMESEAVAQLEEIAAAIVSGEAFRIPDGLLDAIANAVNTIAGTGVVYPSSTMQWRAAVNNSTYHMEFVVDGVVLDAPIYVFEDDGYVCFAINSFGISASTVQARIITHSNGNTVKRWTLDEEFFGDNSFYVLRYGAYGVTYAGLPRTLEEVRSFFAGAYEKAISLFELLTPSASLSTATDFLTGEEIAADGANASTANPAVPTERDLTIPIGLAATLLGTMVTPAEDVKSITFAPAIPIVIPDLLDITPDLTTPDGIKDFVANFGNFVSGLFDWLPAQFASRIDGFFVTLIGFIGLLVVVKIIDIIWPG